MRTCEHWEGSHDPVNSPSHYTYGGIETIDIMRAKMTSEQFEGYLLGNVMKYIMRYRYKNGVQDLEKAKWYLIRLIEECGEGKRCERTKRSEIGTVQDT